jgi:hypothetical protein
MNFYTGYLITYGYKPTEDADIRNYIVHVLSLRNVMPKLQRLANSKEIVNVVLYKCWRGRIEHMWKDLMQSGAVFDDDINNAGTLREDTTVRSDNDLIDHDFFDFPHE